ncbi:EAL domain-containing protein [Paenibacillus sp. PL2-23]|uniref:EAL domain-containing protein n=1 Tax=Paenibacillus sp. PL2-23 TaxID=2100729 RepID=UPI0030F4F3D6
MNVEVMGAVAGFLRSRDAMVELDNDRLYFKEESLADFYDFCRDHMDVERMAVRTSEQAEWKPFGLVPDMLGAEWVDRLITENRIEPWAQPIIDRNGELFAHEMLARFVRPEGGLQSPFEVFGAAKLRDRVYALDRMCRMAAIRSAVHLPKKVFINFVPTSIYSPAHCLQSTVALAQELGFHSSKFVFEVVESEEVGDIAHLKSILEYYKAGGFQYALDDVGEGFSTAQMLRDITPHYMKLDKSYVQGVAGDPDKQEMAAQMLTMALELGSVPLAEGIEAEEDYEWLREQGFELFQGYWFARPAPIARAVRQ